MKNKRIILDNTQLELTIKRLCYQLIENHNDFSETVLLGLQPRGIFMAKQVHEALQKITGNKNIPLGSLDTTFFRDDFRRRTRVFKK